MIPVPRIALVGRPNVGKSTLFNRIVGRRQAIIDSRPGSTRDRNYAQTSWQGAAFELVDTGGLLLESDDPLLGPASAQAERAIGEADLVVLVVDGRAGLMPDDSAIAQRLRKSAKKVLVAVNKIEGKDDTRNEFTALGFDRVVTLSAEHGLGVGDLLDEALAEVPRVEAAEEEAPPRRLAIVGRPNVGKSTLFNRLIGRRRSLVRDVPGVTRDRLYGTAVFEGMCAYNTPNGPAIFRLKDHIERLFSSARIFGFLALPSRKKAGGRLASITLWSPAIIASTGCPWQKLLSLIVEVHDASMRFAELVTGFTSHTRPSHDSATMM